MIKKLKTKFLRILARIESGKINRRLSKLTEEQKIVYNIARKFLSDEDSVLESSPRTGIFYIKNGMMLIKFDAASIHFVNGKYSYFFSYDLYLMESLKEIYHRKKELLINHLIKEISFETTGHLQKIYNELKDK